MHMCKEEIFTLATTFSHSLGQKHSRKLKFEKSYRFFHPANGKFYYITHLCEKGLIRRFDFFFKIFKIRYRHTLNFAVLIFAVLNIRDS